MLIGQPNERNALATTSIQQPTIYHRHLAHHSRSRRPPWPPIGPGPIHPIIVPSVYFGGITGAVDTNADATSRFDSRMDFPDTLRLVKA